MLSFRSEIPKNRFEGLKTQSLLTRVVQEKQAELAKNKPNAELSEVEQTGENTASAKIRFFRSKKLGRFTAVQQYDGLNKNGTQHRSSILLRFARGREMVLKRAFFVAHGHAIYERLGQDRDLIANTIKMLEARLNAH